MNREEIRNLLSRTLCEITGCKPSDITEDKELIKDLGVESIDVVDICFEMERALGGNLNLLQAFQTTPFTEKTTQQGPTVKNLIDYILAARPSP